jgi:serine/threonine-protein kinase
MLERENVPAGVLPVAEGEVLAGKYRVDRVLGVGGMGVVVAATHIQLDQRVALKFMLPHGLENGPLVERFTREARAAARLRSDHVARVLDVGTMATGSPYMVMEFLEGSDLGAVLESRGPLSVDGAVDYLLQACDAVAEAHSLGIVHRDLKPRNLFLTHRNDGRPLVKVLDFGISKQKTGGPELSLTRTSEIMGSPNYMSPEQLRASRAADERSDIWALGVILYELLTAQVPFQAESVTQLTAMVLSDPPVPIQSLRSGVPDELARVIDRCLQKDPSGRFQSIAELSLALQRFGSPDTRDLAARIARIALGPRPANRAGAPMPNDAHSVGARTSGTLPATWTGSTTTPSAGKKAAVIAVIVGLAAATAGGAAKLLLDRPMSAGAASARRTQAAEASAPAPAPAAPAAAASLALHAIPAALGPADSAGDRSWPSTPSTGGDRATVTLPPAARASALIVQTPSPLAQGPSPLAAPSPGPGPLPASASPTAVPAPAGAARVRAMAAGRPGVSASQLARGGGDAGASAGAPSEDAPRYRTNW